MATETPTFTANTYAGEAATEYISRALFAPEGVVEKGLVKVLPNIKKRQVLQKFDQEIEFIDPSAKFNATGSGFTLDENYIDPVKYELHRELDFSKLIEGWEAARLMPGSWNDRVPPSDLEQFLLNDQTAKMALANENLYVFGKNSPKYKGRGFKFSFTDNYLGIIGRMENEATVKETLGSRLEIASVSGTTITTTGAHGLYDGDYVSFDACPWFSVTIGGSSTSLAGQDMRVKVTGATTFEIPYTVSGTNPGGDPEGFAVFINRDNVVEVLASVYMNMPEEIESASDLRIVVPTHVAKAYKIAQAMVATGAGSFTASDKVLNFIDKALISHNVWAPNTIAAYEQKNLVLGTDLLSDENTVRTWDLRESTGDELIRLKAQMKSDIQIAQPEDVYFVTPFASML